MSTDYGEKERQFLETLKADTGRALEDWMGAIAAQGLSGRNEIIDWLRQQGFMFSKASWVERIHNNGGKPIYADVGTRRPRPPAQPTVAQPQSKTVMPPRTPTSSAGDPSDSPPAEPTKDPQRASTVPTSSAGADLAAFDAMLARAKAYRPLAVFLIAEIRKAVPSVSVRLLDGGLAFCTDERDFAVLAISSKELKLGLRLERPAPDVALEPSRLTLRAAPPMTHMAVLTDARQVGPALIETVKQAAAGT